MLVLSHTTHTACYTWLFTLPPQVKAEKLGNYRWYNRDRGMSGKDVQHADDQDEGERTKKPTTMKGETRTD